MLTDMSCSSGNNNVWGLFIWGNHNSVRISLIPLPVVYTCFFFFFGSILTGNGGNGQHADEVNMVRLAFSFF